MSDKTLRLEIPNDAATIINTAGWLLDQAEQLDPELCREYAEKGAILVRNAKGETTTDNGLNDGTSAPVVDDAVEFDKRGWPWDERIHASTKSKNADGTWRNKKGVDKKLLAQVEDELERTVNTTGVIESAPADPVEPVAPPATPSVAPPATPTRSGDDMFKHSDGNVYSRDVLHQSGWTDDQIETLERVDTVATDGYDELTFPEFLAKAMEKGIDNNHIAEVVKKHGLDATVMLATRPDLIPAVATELFA